jgi:hypothetical protein
MFDFTEALALMLLGGALVMAGVTAGGWLVYKSRNAVPGEKLFGGVPKGEVYTIPDVQGDFPQDNNSTLAEKTEKFMKIFEGGNQWKV